MKRSLLFFTLILLHGLSNAQNKKVDLSKVNTVQQAKEFNLSHPEYAGNVFSIMPEQDIAEISPNIFSTLKELDKLVAALTELKPV